jgi:hypothetical protein
MIYGIVRCDILRYFNWLSKLFHGNGSKFFRNVIYVPVSMTLQSKIPQSDIV